MPEELDAFELELRRRAEAHRKKELAIYVVFGVLSLGSFLWWVRDPRNLEFLRQNAVLLAVSITAMVPSVVVALWLLPGKAPDPFKEDGMRVVWLKAAGLVLVTQVASLIVPLLGILWFLGLVALFQQSALRSLLLSVSVYIWSALITRLFFLAKASFLE